MKRITSIAALAALAVAGAGSASAQDYFAGASILAPNSARYDTMGQRLKSSNDPLRLKLYGGVHLNDTWALEGGFAHFGKDRFAGQGISAGISSDVLYVAARSTLNLGNDWELFGRVGVSGQRYRIEEQPGGTRNENGFSPLLGIGVGYKLTENATLTLEAENFGRIGAGKGHLGRSAYSAGIKFSF